ncbi:MAG: hypothetical protein K2R98_02665 [Gemmataceae bacterium]|nr:hypothetical protein [Gemmataceae bacterium]
MIVGIGKRCAADTYEAAKRARAALVAVERPGPAAVRRLDEHLRWALNFGRNRRVKQRA